MLPIEEPTIPQHSDTEGDTPPRIPREPYLDAVATAVAGVGVRDRVMRYCHALASFSDQSGRAAGETKEGRKPGLSVAAIAVRMARSESTVHRARLEWELAGVGQVERRPGRPSVYHLSPVEHTPVWRHVQMRRERSAAARARGHRGRVTDSPERHAPEWICPRAGCGWKGAAPPCAACGHDPP